MCKVRKRDGSVVEFDGTKIENAIKKAFEATGTKFPASYAFHNIMANIAMNYNEKVSEEGILDIEDIQDAVEKVLAETGYWSVAKAYGEYRRQRANVREIGKNAISPVDLMNGYLGSSDWRVKENSTVMHTLGGLILNNSGAVTANYWLSEIYDDEIMRAHKDCLIHIHDLSMLAAYCAGWNLKQLIQTGIAGVANRTSCGPAKHLGVLSNQMVNFLGIMQNEWAGAQAFSSFDTYLAPYVKKDNLSYKEVKQAIQNFVFGVNMPSRWGCVDTDTEVLSTEGFKKYDELKEGDMIYTWHEGRLELNPVRKVVVKPFKGNLHAYKGRGYNQTVTPNHRMLVKKYNEDVYEIKRSEEIFDVKTSHPLPLRFASSSINGLALTDDEIRMAAMVYTDGTIDMRGSSVHKVVITKSPNRTPGVDEILAISARLGLTAHVSGSTGGFDSPINRIVFYGEDARKLVKLVGQKDRIDAKFMEMDMRQAQLFLETWSAFDGSDDKLRCQYDNEVIHDQLQQIAILSGAVSSTWHRNKTNYIKIRKPKDIFNLEREEVPYDGLVWCPNVENGTAVFRKDGCVFISGQTQAPFSNITLDWVIPDDMKDMPAIVGGEEMPFTYGDCQKEADMVNKAFLEVMLEGDYNGRGFQYPIPTYSITKNYDWSETENNKLLFEMAAKYGSPYFANYVNSDMNPSDVRSMAILGTQCVIYRDGAGRVSKNEIRHLVHNWINAPENQKPKYEMLMNGKFVPVIDMFKVPYEKYPTYVEIETEMGVKQPFSYDHRCPVIRNGEYMEVMSQDVLPGDKLLLARHAYNDGEEAKGCPGDYDTGKIVGLYLAKGWIAHDGNEVIFAINEEREDLTAFITDYFQPLACRVSSVHDPDGHIFKVHVYGLAAAGLVKQFVSGDKAAEKRLTYHVYDTAADFRKGLYDGYLTTDGSPKNNLLAHMTNKELCSDLIILGATIGRYASYSVNENNTRYFKPDKSDKEKFTSYRLTISNPEEYNEDFYLVGVKKVTELPSRTEYVYNFTVNTAEHLYTLPNGIITHQCCRLRLDLRDLRRRNGGFFGAGESTGSVGVVTLNLPHIAYISKTEDEFWVNLDHYMDVAARSLDVKRDVITKLLNSGLYPYTKAYLGSFDNHFSTIGLVGGNEMCLNARWLGKDLTHKESQDFVEKMLLHMRSRLSDYQEKYAPALFNLEATPAESTSYRFAKHDKERYPDIITANEHGTPYYTNSTNLPVGTTDDVFDALDIQDRFQPLYTSGTVFHTFLGEMLPSWKSAAMLVKQICSNYKLPYISLTPTYSICPEHGYIAGEHFTCPKCGGETEVYSRITGYYRPVKNWNDGKAQEFKDRKEYAVGKGTPLIRKPEKTPVSKPEETPCEGIGQNCPVPDAARQPATERTAAMNETKDGKDTGLLLFTTPSCPNCRIAKSALDKNGIPYQVIDATAEPELAIKYEIMSAPTLVNLADGSKYTGAGAIIGNIKNLK